MILTVFLILDIILIYPFVGTMVLNKQEFKDFRDEQIKRMIMRMVRLGYDEGIAKKLISKMARDSLLIWPKIIIDYRENISR